MSEWRDLSLNRKRHLRKKIQQIVSERGPISASDIKRLFTKNLRWCVETAINILVGREIIFENECGRLFIEPDEIADGFVIREPEDTDIPPLLFEGRLCTLPTNYGPGHPKKVLLMAARYESGKSLWNDGDKKECEAPQEVFKSRVDLLYEAESEFEDAEVL